MEQLRLLFQDKPEVWNFIQLYVDYCHRIDDLIDEKFEAEALLKCLYLASLIYSSDYFSRNRSFLLPIEHHIINTYADSVKWEKESDTNKTKYVDMLRHCGLDMILKIVQLEFGWDILRRTSDLIRNQIYNP